MLEVELGDPHAQQQLDAEFAVLVARPKAQARERHGAEQEALGEVRSLIGELGLGADKQDLASKAGVPKPCSDRVPGGAAANDYRFRESSRTRSNDQPRYPPRTAIANA